MDKKVSFKTIISYFWPHIWKYKKTFFLGFVLHGASIAMYGGITPLYYKKIFDIISSGGVDAADKAPLLMALFIQLAVFVFSYNVLFRISDFLMAYCQSNILKEISDYTFKKISEHSYSFFSDNFSGSLVAKMKRFVSSFENLHDTIMFNFWLTGVKFSAIIGVLFWTAPALGFVFLAWSVFYLTMTIFFVKKKVKYDILAAEEDSRITARISDVIGNILNIKIFAAKETENKNFSVLSEVARAARSKSWNFNNIIFASQGFVLMILEVATIYFSIKLWLNGTISAGSVVMAQIYVVGVFISIWDLGRAIAKFYRSLSDASEMVEIFETTPSVLDKQNCEPCAISKGDIVFDNVTFGYNENPVFENFNLSILSGQKVGLVGHSGSGKSTIIKLLLRFFDPQKGKILIDGQNIADIKQDDLRKNIAYVPQDPALFHRSLKENIIYGKPEATNEEMVEAAKNAHAHEFISSFPQGYETLVGERGIKLSGGERQRVAIARAMLKKAPVLILDEATSSLDSMSENLIKESFDKLMENKTAIVIAHRLSTIQKMDRIIVLDKGKTVEDGSHQELLDKKGAYYDLWNHQVGGFLAE